MLTFIIIASAFQSKGVKHQIHTLRDEIDWFWMSFFTLSKKGWSNLYSKTKEHITSHHVINPTKFLGGFFCCFFFFYILSNVAITKVTRIPVKTTVRAGQVSTRSPSTTEKEKKIVTMFYSLKQKILFLVRNIENPQRQIFLGFKNTPGTYCHSSLKKKIKKLWSSSLCGEVWV